MTAKKKPAKSAAKRKRPSRTKPKRIRPRALRPGERLQPGKLAKGATAREIDPANLIVEVLGMNRPLLVAAYDDWNAKMIDNPVPLAQQRHDEADFLAQRLAGVPSTLGGKMADFLLESIRTRLKAGK